MTKILVIADTQCKPQHNLDYMRAIGNYIAAKRPDVLVHIGDHYDFESLSSYDKGKANTASSLVISPPVNTSNTPTNPNDS